MSISEGKTEASVVYKILHMISLWSNAETLCINLSPLIEYFVEKKVKCPERETFLELKYGWDGWRSNLGRKNLILYMGIFNINTFHDGAVIYRSWYQHGIDLLSCLCYSVNPQRRAHIFCIEIWGPEFDSRCKKRKWYFLNCYIWSFCFHLFPPCL